MENRQEIDCKAIALRRKLGEDAFSPLDIFALVQMIDSLTLIFYPLGKNISGMCIKSSLSTIIAINSDMSVGRQKFSLAHELYHLFFDEELLSTICSSIIGSGTLTEKTADQFASHLLMPSVALYDTIQSYKLGAPRKLTMDEVIKLEQHFSMSHQAMLVRLQEEGEITTTDASKFRNDVRSHAAKLGFDTSLYKPSPENKKRFVLGHYIVQVGKLLESDIISYGKYEELLLDAFRDDIVFGEDLEGGEWID